MRNHLLLLHVLLMSLASPAWGTATVQAGAAPAVAASEDVADGIADATPLAPLVLDGRELFKLRGFASRSAQQRADDIVARIVVTARDPRVAVDAIQADERPLGTRIVAGKLTLMTVLDADARVEGVERSVLAQAYLQQIRQSVAAYRSEREPWALARGAGLATAAAAASAIVLYLLWRLRRRVDAVLERRFRARLDDLKIGGFKPLHTQHLWRGLRGLVAAAFALLALAGLYLGLDFALAQFPGTRMLAAFLLDGVAGPLVEAGHALLGAIPGLTFLTLLALVVRYALKTLRMLFAAVEQGSVVLQGFDREWAIPTYRIVRLLVVAFALVIAFPYIPGSHTEAFKGISLFLGIVFSLGSTSIVANVVAGYSMTYRRAFRVGDKVKVGDVTGVVTEMRLQVTHLRSPKNEDVVIPNSTLLTKEVINYSTLAATHGLVLHTTVGIGYDTPWRQVEAMLLAAAERTPGLLQQPPAFVHELALGDFAISYELNVHCDRPRDMPAIYSELHRNILDVFNEYGVAIMTPAYEGDTEQPKFVPRERWFEAPARRAAPEQG